MSAGPERPRGDDLTGRVCADLRVHACVASGGSSDVYRATPIGGGKDLAVKVAADGSPALARRFLRESYRLAPLRHECIVVVRGHGVLPDGRAFLVSDFVDGQPLDEFVADAADEATTSVLLAVANALAYLHGNGIAHGDLKPANVLVHADGRPVLVDFGVSYRSGDGMTATGLVPMTPYYASPERLAGSMPGPADDVFAFGILARDAWSETTMVAGAPPRLRRDRKRFVSRCLAADPRLRYASALALQADLCALARGRLPWHFAWRLLARQGQRRWRVLALAAALLAVVVAFAMTGERRIEAARRETLSVSEFLVRLLDQASPAAAGPDVTLTAAWRRAEASIATTFRDHPHGEARVRMAYGRAYAAVHDWVPACTHLQRAIELLARDGPASERSRRWCERLLAQCRARR